MMLAGLVRNLEEEDDALFFVLLNASTFLPLGCNLTLFSGFEGRRLGVFLGGRFFVWGFFGFLGLLFFGVVFGFYLAFLSLAFF